MDIFKFINSRDIAEHLRKIDYQFSPLEAMYLIHEANKFSIREKHEAYRELMELYPDFIVEMKRIDIEPQPLVTFLTELINSENALIEECMREGDQAFYYADCLYRDSWESPDDIHYAHVYASYNDCLKKEAGPYVHIRKIEITKRYTAFHRVLSMTVSPDGTIFYVCCGDDKYQSFFYSTNLRLPTPFKKGDILVDVQECTAKWAFRGIGGEFNGVVLKSLDENLMNEPEDTWYTGYFQDKRRLLYFDDNYTYLDLEYYRGELTGRLGILKAMSNFLKGKIDGELLMKAYHIFAMREQLEYEHSQLYLSDEERRNLVGIGEDPYRED